MKPLPSELLSQPGAWTQGAMGRNRFNEPVQPRIACKWCIVGAMYFCEVGYSDDRKLKLISKVNKAGFTVIAQWNDARGRTQAEVVAMLKECGL